MTERLSPFELTQRWLVRLLMALPRPAQLLLAGGKPTRHGSETLAPELQLMLKLREVSRAPSFSDLPPQKMRKLMARDTLIHRTREIPVAEVRDLEIGSLRVRHYRPYGANRPLLVFYHGGGFALCGLETHDGATRFLCKYADVHILSVDYRLAPEHPFPAAIDDGLEAFEWATKNAEKLGADPKRVGVAGDSAGGNLAAVVSQLRALEGQSIPSLQLLIYPATDRSVHYESLSHFEKGFLLSRKDIEWFQNQYAPGHSITDARLSPRLSPKLGGLPPAIIVTAAFDPLRDEGEAYAEALSAAGTSARLMRMKGMIHGFINMAHLSRACRQAMHEIAGAVHEHWEKKI